jgi:hypothetical protein
MVISARNRPAFNPSVSTTTYQYPSRGTVTSNGRRVADHPVSDSLLVGVDVRFRHQPHIGHDVEFDPHNGGPFEPAEVEDHCVGSHRNPRGDEFSPPLGFFNRRLGNKHCVQPESTTMIAALQIPIESEIHLRIRRRLRRTIPASPAADVSANFS